MKRLTVCFFLLLCGIVLHSAPLVSIPRTASSPVIDGKINATEWQDAVRLTGFSGLDGKYMVTDTEIFIIYDMDHLFFAVRSSFKAAQPYKGLEFGEGKIWRNDTVDIRLQPDNGNPEKIFLFAADPIGGFYSSRERKFLPEALPVRYASTTKDSGETIGGVESFSKAIWEYELAIPFKTLEMNSPAEGDSILFNLMRNYSEAMNLGNKRWTSWTCPTPGAQFGRPEDFAKLVFGGKTPVLKMDFLGDMTGGDIRFTGKIRNPDTAPQHTTQIVRVTLPETQKIALVAQSSSENAAGSELAFESTGKVYLKRSLDLKADFMVQKDGQTVFENTFYYTALPAFHCQIIPLFLQDKLVVKANVQKVSGLSQNFAVKASVLLNGEKTALAEIALAAGEDPKDLSASLDISSLKPGDYSVSIELLDGKVAAAQNLPLKIQEKPTWLGNKLGISEQVPVPFSPLKSTSNSAMVCGREYQFGNSLLPEQIVNQGEAMFVKPMELRAETEQGTVIWKNPAVKRISTSDIAAVFSFAAEHPQVNLKGTMHIEYDGFIRYDFSLEPASSINLKSLSMHIFPTGDNGVYMRAYQLEPETLGLAAYLDDDGQDGIVTKNIWQFSGKGWKWETNFLHYMWMGGDDSGLTIAFDSAANFRINQFVKVLPYKDSREWTINFIDQATELSGPLSYTMALQATPTKPLAKPETYHFGYLFPSPHESAFKGFYAAACYAGLDEGCAYPGLSDTGKSMAARMYKQQGLRIFPDGAYSWAANDIPEIMPYRQEWLQNPYFSMSYRGKVTEAYCRKGSFTDYLLYSYKQRYDDGARGLYHDGVNPGLCHSEFHHCGTRDLFGKTHSTMRLFEVRNTFKRIYTMYKELSPDSFIFVHNAPMTFLGTFADGSCEGESWSEDYSVMTEQQFRAGFAVYPRQSCAFNLYPFVSYSWRYPDLKAVIKPAEIIAIALTHTCYPVPSSIGSSECIGLLQLYPVWEIMDEWFCSSKWIRYWSKNHPVSVSTPDLKATVFLKKEQKSALLLISSITPKNVSGTFAVDVQKLFGEKGEYQITEMIPAELAYDKKSGMTTARTMQRVSMGNAEQTFPAEFKGRAIRYLEISKK